jgi:hypothetical protein
MEVLFSGNKRLKPMISTGAGPCIPLLSLHNIRVTWVCL